MTDNRPIGIFDSGLGGLTVLKEVIEIMPEENTIYFGDSGRAPYGTKSKEVITKYTFQDVNFLLSKDVKMIVIGCNTASACSLDKVKEKVKIPVIDVVEPGARAAVGQTKNGRIGVIGTSATIGSKVYENAIKSLMPEAEIFTKACTLFVPLAEEGWWSNNIAEMVCEEYLSFFKDKNIDTLILGCTHYPLLKNTIQNAVGEGVVLVNSAVELAKVVKNTLGDFDIGCETSNDAKHCYYTSDSVDKFKTLGGIFLEKEITNAEKVDIDRYENYY